MQPNVLVTIVLGGLALFRPRSKVVCIIFFLFMWTLWGFNLWNGDYVAYMEEYNYPMWDSIEVGYKVICGFFSSWLPFQGFLIIVSGCILSFFCYCGLKYTHFPALFSLLYFPMFILEFVYLRNYICLVFLFYAFFRLIFENGNTKTSVVFVLLASTIHIFSICFLPIVLLLKSKINYRSLLVLVFIFSILALVASQTVINSTSYLSSKADVYARTGGNAISMTTPFHIFVVLVCYIVYQKTKFKGIPFSKSAKFFVNFNILSLILLPVYFIVPYTASRSLRLLIVLNLFFFLYLLWGATKKTKIYSSLGIIFSCLTIGYFFSIQKFEFVILPLYNCNALWGYDSAFQLISY